MGDNGIFLRHSLEDIYLSIKLLLLNIAQHRDCMGNDQSINWQDEYQLVETLAPNHQRVRRKDNPNNYYEVFSLFVPGEQQQTFMSRVRHREQDKNIYIQRLLQCSRKEEHNFCGNSQRLSLVFRQSSPSLVDHCQYRKETRQQFSPDEICCVIRNVCLGLAYLKGIRQNHGSVNLKNIIANKEVYLKDPILIEQQQAESMGFRRTITGFPSPQKLREQYDVLINFDQHTSDLFSLGVTALQLQYLDRNMLDIYSVKSTSYHNTYINFETVSMLVGGIKDNRLREWVWTLLHPEDRARGRIYDLIRSYQVDNKKLRKLLQENPLRIRPEERLVQPIDPYVESEQTIKNSLIGQAISLKKSESINHMASNRPSLMMPISHQNGDHYPGRMTLVNGYSTGSLNSFINGNVKTTQSNVWNYNHPNSFGYNIQEPKRIYKTIDEKITSPASYVPAFPKLQEKSSRAIPFDQFSQFKPFTSFQSQNQSNAFLYSQPSLDMKELSQSLHKLSFNLKSLIDSQSQQLINKRQNTIIYDVNSSFKLSQILPSSDNSILPSDTPHRLVFRKANSLYTDKLAPVIPEVQEEHSNLTQNQYVIEQYEIGTKYEGFKRNGRRNGTGKFYYSQGSCYDGQWKDNKMHGFGVLTYPNGSIAYQGQWKDDEFEGKGVIYNDDPTPIAGMLNPTDLTQVEGMWIMYQGQMKNGKRNGQGKLTFINGEYFEGEFRDDQITGDGDFFSLNGSKVVGRWEGGLLAEAYQ